MESLVQEQCVPCTGDVPALTDAEIQELHLYAPMWEVVETEGVKWIRRTFAFDTYGDGVIFASRIGGLADQQNHHPIITVRYKKVEVEWYTHAIEALHRNDFIMAAKTDDAYLKLLDETREKSVVQEASEESFPASDSPGWIGSTQEEEKEKQS